LTLTLVAYKASHTSSLRPLTPGAEHLEEGVVVSVFAHVVQVIVFPTRADAFLRVNCRFSVYLFCDCFTSTKVQNLRVDCTPCLFISGHWRLGIHLCVCVCVCVCVCGWRERGRGRQTDTDTYIRDLGSTYICVCA
jgi:hypothetical protein